MNQNIKIQATTSLNQENIQVDVLRLDTIHPIVSGNKWFKLKYYLQEAKDQKKNFIASFGGPYSNHLVALAYLAKQNNLKSIGFVRSNADEPFTTSLKEALDYGMELQFLGRTHFKIIKKEKLQNALTYLDTYFIDEGGYGALGVQGAASILADEQTNSYSHIICAVGTGTMMAGLLNASKKHQHIIGIPVLKNEASIQNEINQFLINKDTSYTLFHNHHLGGYAKTTPVQIDFMNQLWVTEKIPTDIVYTSKVFMATKKLLADQYFASNAKILIIHSGGLQGNKSLPEGRLVF